MHRATGAPPPRGRPAPSACTDGTRTSWSAPLLSLPASPPANVGAVPSPAPWIRRFIGAILAQPRIYDALQVAAGVRTVDAHLGKYTRDLAERGIALDVGGGTGRLRSLFSESWRYVCVDNELPRLHGAAPLRMHDRGILADALALPIRDRSVDLAVCVMVTHHLPLEDLPAFFGELRRVLRPNGRLIYLDWLAVPERFLSRVLARYDQGAFPHTRAELEDILTNHFECSNAEVFTVLHRYGLWCGRPRPEPSQ